MNCSSCPRNCKIDRENVSGFCGVGKNLTLAKATLHWGEEPILSSGKGSGAIFFSGCNLRCVYCQNYKVSRGFGKEISIKRLSEIFKELEDLGANNINLVTPTHFIDQILQAFELYKPQIPIVYNSSGYEKVESLKRLEGIVDIYLPDFKYSDNMLAQKYSKCPNYVETAKNAILEMRRQTKDVVVDGLMKSGLIIRHLMLPNAIDNTLGVIDWINENFSKDTYISLMGQYIPYGDSFKFEELKRKIKPIEYKIAINRLYNYGFLNSFVQDLDSAQTTFIPEFNLDGV
ncbi:MAG: radical SAM protein [Christensenella sp.]|nr:radical SAM protein [Christensenella sp.]